MEQVNGPVRCVVFDVGGVLLTQGERDFDREILEALGIEGYPPVYGQMFPAMQRGEVDEATFWARVAGHKVSVESLDRIWQRHFRPIPARCVEWASWMASALSPSRAR